LAVRSDRLALAHQRGFADAERAIAQGRERLVRLALRLDPGMARASGRARDRLDALERMRLTLGYAQTLKRGFAVVRGDGNLVTGKAEAERAGVLELEFRDGRLVVSGRVPRKGKASDGQGSLF
jgi:exodeoxyribonuclease VII large subunit